MCGLAQVFCIMPRLQAPPQLQQRLSIWRKLQHLLQRNIGNPHRPLPVHRDHVRHQQLTLAPAAEHLPCRWQLCSCAAHEKEKLTAHVQRVRRHIWQPRFIV